MRKSMAVALFLSFLVAAAQNAAPAKKSASGGSGGAQHAGAQSGHAQPGASHPATPALSSLHCELLPPFYRSDGTKVLQEKIGPNEASPTGNSFFTMPHPVKYVVVHLTPSSSDAAAYPVKIITRYIDDTIYENVMDAIEPHANTPITWGPLATLPAAVAQDKVPDVLIVKVQENYALQPHAKGFSYALSVEGCN